MSFVHQGKQVSRSRETTDEKMAQRTQIAEYKVKRRKEGGSARTVNLELILMTHAYNLTLREWGWVKENPASKVKKDKVSNFIERWLTLEEEGKLMKASPE